MPVTIDVTPITATVVVSQVLPNTPFAGDLVGLQLITGAVVNVGSVVGLLDSAVARLFNTSLASLAPNTTAAELVAAEATFSGYNTAGKVVVFGTTILAGGGAEVASGLLQFDFVAPVGTPVPDTVAGFWIENTDGVPIFAAQFAAPIPMTQNGNAVAFVVVYNSTTAVG
jgi:hypothetical protein